MKIKIVSVVTAAIKLNQHMGRNKTMKTAQHTPGPWKVRKSLNPNNTDCYSVEIREDGWKEILCSHVGGYLDHPGGKRFQGSREANAALIAAAPELLDMLEMVHAMLDRPDCERNEYRVKLLVENAINKVNQS